MVSSLTFAAHTINRLGHCLQRSLCWVWVITHWAKLAAGEKVTLLRTMPSPCFINRVGERGAFSAWRNVLWAFSYSLLNFKYYLLTSLNKMEGSFFFWFLPITWFLKFLVFLPVKLSMRFSQARSDKQPRGIFNVSSDLFFLPMERVLSMHPALHR